MEPSDLLAESYGVDIQQWILEELPEALKYVPDVELELACKGGKMYLSEEEWLTLQLEKTNKEIRDLYHKTVLESSTSSLLFLEMLRTAPSSGGLRSLLESVGQSNFEQPPHALEKKPKMMNVVDIVQEMRSQYGNGCAPHLTSSLYNWLVQQPTLGAEEVGQVIMCFANLFLRTRNEILLQHNRLSCSVDPLAVYYDRRLNCYKHLVKMVMELQQEMEEKHKQLQIISHLCRFLQNMKNSHIRKVNKRISREAKANKSGRAAGLLEK